MDPLVNNLLNRIFPQLFSFYYCVGRYAIKDY